MEDSDIKSSEEHSSKLENHSPSTENIKFDGASKEDEDFELDELLDSKCFPFFAQKTKKWTSSE